MSLFVILSHKLKLFTHFIYQMWDNQLVLLFYFPDFNEGLATELASSVGEFPYTWSASHFISSLQSKSHKAFSFRMQRCNPSPRETQLNTALHNSKQGTSFGSVLRFLLHLHFWEDSEEKPFFFSLKALLPKLCSARFLGKKQKKNIK